MNVTENKSFDFALFRILAKIFDSFSKDFIAECRLFFCLPLLSDSIQSSKLKFLLRYASSENTICSVFAVNAKNELSLLSTSRPRLF